VAPFSGDRCAGYLAACQDEGHFDHQGGGGFNSVTQQRWRDFVLEDGTGKALVQVAAQVEVEAKTRPIASVPRERVKTFLESADWRGTVVPDDWTPKEWRLSDGDVVTVFGAARWEHDPDPEGSRGSGYRAAPRRLVVRAPAALPLVIIQGA
jgi:hypothetical protein